MPFDIPESLREGYENWLQNGAGDGYESSSSSSEDDEPAERQLVRARRRAGRDETRVVDPTLVSSSSSEGEDDESAGREVVRTRRRAGRNETRAVDPTLVHRARPAPVVLPIPRRVDSRDIAYVEHFEVVSERFGVRAVQYRFAPANVDPQEDVFEGFVRFITAVYDMIRREFSPDNFVQVDLYSKDLTDQRIGTPLVRVRDASRDVLLDTLENIMQSNFALTLDSGDLTIEIQHVTMTEARGYEHARKHAILTMNQNMERVLKESTSLAEVDPDMDTFCSVVSLLMGKRWLENKQEGRRNTYFKRRFKAGMKLRRLYCWRCSLERF